MPALEQHRGDRDLNRGTGHHNQRRNGEQLAQQPAVRR
jgi:hypothetical protein